MSDVPVLLAEEKQALLAAIVSSSQDAIISKTLQGIITSWNPAAERLFAYGENEAIGRHISLIIPKNRLHEENFIIGEISSGKRIEHFETIRETKEGFTVQISLSISPIRNSKGIIIGASKIARDISAQKKAAERQGMLAAIVNNSDDAIISKTLQGIITSWNRAAEKMFGYPEAEAVGQHISLIIPEDRLDEETYIIGEISKGNSIAHFETTRISKKGEPISISLTISPILNEKQEIIGASKIARDISETLSIHKEKEQLYIEVKDLSQKKDEFIAMATHELKTPITTLNGFLQLLQMRLPSDDVSHSFVNKCLKQVNKLNTLINDLLDISRVHAGKLQLRLEVFDIVSLTNEVLELYKELTSCNLIFIADASVLVYADRLRIEQVLINLIANAIKYSPGGGAITIEVSEHDNEILVSVKDKGIGIDSEYLVNLFSRFYRAVDPKYNISGLGMGLYISKEIVERHNGKISVETEKGQGSTFSFRLPKQQTEIQPDAVRSPIY